MAHYAYKTVVYDRIPSKFSDEYIKVHEEKLDGYDHDCNYDGDGWHLTAAYIDWLEAGKPEAVREFIETNFWN